MLPKRPYVVIFTLGVWLLLSAANFGSFDATIPYEYGPWMHIAILSFYAWFMIFWLWGLHSFSHHVLSFLPRAINPRAGDPRPDTEVAILYTTCDDFDAEACESALRQTHPRVRLLICDDSSDPWNRAVIDRWAAAQEQRVRVVRRGNNEGFKAGNLNHAIAYYVHEEHILICDADEIIPPDFVEKLLPYFVEEQVGFVQASHRARTIPKSHFAGTIAAGVDLFFGHFLPAKNRFGYVSCQGHGVIIRRSVWEQVGGFPHRLCEDMAFGARALEAGYRGVFVPTVVAEEATPQTYRALLKSRSRTVRGAIEFFQLEYRRLARSPKATLTEKLDLLITESGAYLGLVVSVSIWGGLIISYLYKIQGYNGTQPWMPFVFALGPAAAAAPLLIKIPKDPVRYGQYMFVMAANYASLMPVLALRAIEQTVGVRNPIFDVSGAIARQGTSPRDFTVSFPYGISLVIGALALHSPTSPLTMCLSLTFLLTPLLYFTEQKGILGAVGRAWGLAPYLAIALLGVWMH